MNNQHEIIETLRERLMPKVLDLKVLFYSRINMDTSGHVIKKNNRKIMRNRRTGHSFLGKTDKQIYGENYLTAQLVRERIKCGIHTPINKPVWCIFLFYFKNFYKKKKRKNDPLQISSTTGDLSNLYQMPEDCLQRAYVLENDALIVSHDLSRKLPSQTGRDYLDIFIIDYSHEDPARNPISN